MDRTQAGKDNGDSLCCAHPGHAALYCGGRSPSGALAKLTRWVGGIGHGISGYLPSLCGASNLRRCVQCFRIPHGWAAMDCV